MFGAFDTSRDLPQAEVTLTYLILSQPRTGSTMLGSALEGTGMAGVPLEYFNPQHLKKLPQPVGPKELQTYYRDVVSRRTTPNGVFGMKLHHKQFASLFMEGGKVSLRGQKFLTSFDRVITISRRDKVAQAMSQITAFRKKNWNSDKRDDEGKQDYEFNRNDVPAILDSIRDAVLGELFWERLCEALKLNPLKVVYEDMCERPDEAFDRVLSYLGITCQTIAPRTVKMSSEASQDAKRRFLRELGIFSQD
jgi:LPS sulfotransferase NodH